MLDDAKRRMIVQLRWLAMQAKKRRDDRMRRTKAELDAETAKIRYSIDKYIARRRAVNLLHVLAADKYKARREARPPTPPGLRVPPAALNSRDLAPPAPADALLLPNQQWHRRTICRHPSRPSTPCAACPSTTPASTSSSSTVASR